MKMEKNQNLLDITKAVLRGTYSHTSLPQGNKKSLMKFTFKGTRKRTNRS